MNKLLLSIFLGTQLCGVVSAEWKCTVTQKLFANQITLTTNEKKYKAFVLPYIEQIEKLPVTDLLIRGSRQISFYRYRDLLIDMVIADFNMNYVLGDHERPLFMGLKESLSALIAEAVEEAGSAIDVEEQVHAIVTIIRESNKAYYKKLVPLHKKMVIKIDSLF